MPHMSFAVADIRSPCSESRDRTGGRVFTKTIGGGDKAVKTEVGAGWLHGAGKSEVHSSSDRTG
jgi:hypothetical protein